MNGRPAAFAILFLLANCATAPQYTARYDVSLTSVERQQRGGDVKRYTNLTNNTFEDEFIRITWSPSWTQFGFDLTSKADSTIRVIWDEASFVGLDGKSDRVIHEGVKIADRGASMPPSVVIRGGKLEDLVEPASHIYWRQGYGTYDPGGWSHTPIVGYGYSAPTEAEVRAKLVPDGSVKVLLPIDTNGTIREYLFDFGVKGTVVPPSTTAG